MNSSTVDVSGLSVDVLDLGRLVEVIAPYQTCGAVAAERRPAKPINHRLSLTKAKLSLLTLCACQFYGKYAAVFGSYQPL